MLTLGSRCLAYHGPLLYEAKVLRLHEEGSNVVQIKEDTFTTNEHAQLPEDYKDKLVYYIHYKGWKPKWDEWVLKERVIQINEENLALQKKLIQTINITKESIASRRKKDPSETPSEKSDYNTRKRAKFTNSDENSNSHSNSNSKDGENVCLFIICYMLLRVYKTCIKHV